VDGVVGGVIGGLTPTTETDPTIVDGVVGGVIGGLTPTTETDYVSRLAVPEIGIELDWFGNRPSPTMSDIERAFVVPVVESEDVYRRCESVRACERPERNDPPHRRCQSVRSCENLAPEVSRFYLGDGPAEPSIQLGSLYNANDRESRALIGPVLAAGGYDRLLTSWLGIDLQEVARSYADRTNDEASVRVQSIFDTSIARWTNRATIIDEYRVVARISDDLAGQIFRGFAADMDGSIGGDFEDLAEWDYGPATALHPGQIVEIDVNAAGFADLSPVNAPIVLVDVEDTYFTAATLELNGANHGIHGMREFGYESLGDGTVAFYTRAISVEGERSIVPTLRGGTAGAEGELKFWTTWVKSLETKLATEHGVVADTGWHQTRFRTGDTLFDQLPADVQEQYRDSVGTYRAFPSGCSAHDDDYSDC